MFAIYFEDIFSKLRKKQENSQSKHCSGGQGQQQCIRVWFKTKNWPVIGLNNA